MNALVPWWSLLVALVLGLILGGIITKKFGISWLAILAWALDMYEDDVVAVARLAWNTPNLIPEPWKRLRFQNSEDKFVEWVKAQIDKLQATVGSVEQTATVQGVTSLRRGGV